MKVYNIEVFNNSMLCIHHEAISEYEYDFDYLSPVESKLELNFHNADARFVRIVSDEQDIDVMGVITSLDDGEQMEIGFKPFTTCFDANILFDTTDQGSASLESIIEKYIQETFVNSGDTLQNLPIGTITLTSSTTNWGMNLKADTEGTTKCKINLYDVLIANSFSNYGIVVEAIPNPTQRVIDITIGKIASPDTVLEIDAPGVTIKKFTVRDASAKVNKLIIYRTMENYLWTKTYYLHPDGTYGTENTDRIFPVVLDIDAVTPSDTSIEKWDEACRQAAVSKFGNMKYDNLIQIEVSPNDPLIKPLDLKIGQIVQVVHNGTAYDTIVSAVKYGDLIELTMGMIRINATKRFRRLLK